MNQKIDTRALRKRLGLTQEQFAWGLGMSVMTIRRWEYGVYSPSPLARKAIEIVYSIKPDKPDHRTEVELADHNAMKGVHYGRRK